MTAQQLFNKRMALRSGRSKKMLPFVINPAPSLYNYGGKRKAGLKFKSVLKCRAGKHKQGCQLKLGEV